jgi:hypothetical protein
VAAWTDHEERAAPGLWVGPAPSRASNRREDDRALARMLGVSLLLGTAATGAAGWGLWSLVASLIS